MYGHPAFVALLSCPRCREAASLTLGFLLAGLSLGLVVGDVAGAVRFGALKQAFDPAHGAVDVPTLHIELGSQLCAWVIVAVLQLAIDGARHVTENVAGIAQGCILFGGQPEPGMKGARLKYRRHPSLAERLENTIRRMDRVRSSIGSSIGCISTAIMSAA